MVGQLFLVHHLHCTHWIVSRLYGASYIIATALFSSTGAADIWRFPSRAGHLHWALSTSTC